MEQKTLSPQTLALYLGCQVAVPEENNKVGRLTGIDWHKGEAGDDIVILDISYSKAKDDWTVLNENENITRVKPILRRLSSMTRDEMIYVYKTALNYNVVAEDACYEIVWNVLNKFGENGHYLMHTLRLDGFNRMVQLIRGLGIDMDGLLDAGLAQEKI